MKQLTYAGLIALALAGAFLLGKSAGEPRPIQDLSASEYEIQMRETLQELDYFARVSGLIRLLDHMDTENLAGGVAAVEGELDTLTENTIRLFVRVWTRVDRQNAYEHIILWPRTKMKYGMVELIFVWAMSNPVEARDALMSIPDEMIREVSVSSLVGGWAKGGHPGVDEYLIGLDNGPLQRKLTAVAVTWILRREGPEAMLAWAESQSGEGRDGFRRVAMERAMNQMVPVDPEAALRWAEKHSGKVYAGTLKRELAKRWVPKDADAAFAWLATLEDPAQRDDLVRVGFTRWSSLDGHAAANWISSTELSPYLDPAVAVFAVNQSKAQAERAMIWAARISDQALRNKTQTDILRFWIHQAPDLANAWIEANNLPPNVIAAARTPNRGRGRTRRPTTLR